MSIHWSYVIVCDRCEETAGDPVGKHQDTPTESRKRLKEDGWIRIGWEDFCDKCAPVELDERA